MFVLLNKLIIYNLLGLIRSIFFFLTDFYNIEELRTAVIKFYEHLCDILFPNGFGNLIIEERNLISNT